MAPRLFLTHDTRAIRRRRLSRFFVFMIAAMAMMALVLDTAQAASGPYDDAPVTRQDAEESGLYFPIKGSGLLRPAPLVATDIQVSVAGPVARYRLRHRFANPTDEWVEGVYVYPLPEDSGVDSLTMMIGTRIIQGIVMEREAAKQTYETAKQEGKKASLVEQERPNIFTTSVANIGPRDDIIIEIGFQETLSYRDDEFTLRFPLVVGPRYIPGSKAIAEFGQGGWATGGATVPDAARITPPVRHPASETRNKVTLSVHLDPGFPIDQVRSPSHALAVVRGETGTWDVGLQNRDTPATRDFVLKWTPSAQATPEAGLFRETVKGEDYMLLMVTPPLDPVADAPARPREVIFIIDTSGSMHGTSIEQARSALGLAIDRLKPADRFNVIQFNEQPDVLFAAPRPASDANRTQARGYIKALEAGGGTEILAAMRAALDGRSDANRLRQVVLLTDGAIGNETEVVRYIHENRGDSRVLTVGIGAVPNGFFMTEAARQGQGTFTYIEDIAEVRDRVTSLFKRLENPALTDIRIELPGDATAEVHPDPIPDLYAGEPLLVTLKSAAIQGNAVVSGKLNGAIWRVAVPLAKGQDHPGIGRLWARNRIASLMAAERLSRNFDSARDAVLETALTHQLVSKYTSLVAVDVIPSRPADAPLDRRDVPTDLPDGWSWEHVFGGDVSLQEAALQKATAARSQGATAGITLNSRRLSLPATATPATEMFVLGTLLLGLGSLLMWVLTRRRSA